MTSISGAALPRSWELVKQQFRADGGDHVPGGAGHWGRQSTDRLAVGPAIRGMIFERRISIGAIAIVLATSVLSTPVYVVLIGGLFKYYLKLIRGEPAGIADAFSGFGSALGQLVLLGLVSGLLSLIGYAAVHPARDLSDRIVDVRRSPGY